MTSINTNVGLMTALQNYDQISYRLNTTQNRISTGDRVSGAVDDASDFSIAQGVRSDIKAYQTVNQSLSGAIGVAQVTISAGTALSNLTAQMRQKLIELANPANTANQQTILENDFSNMVNSTYLKIINDASYNGINLMVVGGGSPASFTSDIKGGQVTLQAFGTATQYNAIVAALPTLNTSAGALAALPLVDALSTQIQLDLGTIGSSLNTIQDMQQQNQSTSDALTQGLGGLVDANMAQEAAKLQAEQTQQQLAAQSISVASSSTQVIRQLYTTA